MSGVDTDGCGGRIGGKSSDEPGGKSGSEGNGACAGLPTVVGPSFSKATASAICL